MMRFCSAFIALLFCAASAWAQPITTSSITGTENILSSMTWLSDPQGSIDYKMASGPEMQQKYTSLAKGFPARASGPGWLRLELAQNNQQTATPPPTAKKKPLYLNFSFLPSGAATLYKTGAFPSQGGASHQPVMTRVYSFQTERLAEPSISNAVYYIQLEETPGLWFNPTLSRTDSKSPILPHDLLLPSILLACLAFCLLRLAIERSLWPAWAAAILACVIIELLLPLPVSGKALRYGDLPVLLAPGIAVMIYAQLGRLLLYSPNSFPKADRVLRFYPIIGMAVALAPLIPGGFWVTRLFPIWGLLLVPLMIIAANALIKQLKGSFAYFVATFMPVLGSCVALYAVYDPAVSIFAESATFWGVAIGSIALIFARAAQPGKQSAAETPSPAAETPADLFDSLSATAPLEQPDAPSSGLLAEVPQLTPLKLPGDSDDIFSQLQYADLSGMTASKTSTANTPSLTLTPLAADQKKLKDLSAENAPAREQQIEKTDLTGLLPPAESTTADEAKLLLHADYAEDAVYTNPASHADQAIHSARHKSGHADPSQPLPDIAGSSVFSDFQGQTAPVNGASGDIIELLDLAPSPLKATTQKTSSLLVWPDSDEHISSQIAGEAASDAAANTYTTAKVAEAATQHEPQKTLSKSPELIILNDDDSERAIPAETVQKVDAVLADIESVDGPHRTHDQGNDHGRHSGQDSLAHHDSHGELNSRHGQENQQDLDDMNPAAIPADDVRNSPPGDGDSNSLETARRAGSANTDKQNPPVADTAVRTDVEPAKNPHSEKSAGQDQLGRQAGETSYQEQGHRQEADSAKAYIDALLTPTDKHSLSSSSLIADRFKPVSAAQSLLAESIVNLQQPEEDPSFAAYGDHCIIITAMTTSNKRLLQSYFNEVGIPCIETDSVTDVIAAQEKTGSPLVIYDADSPEDSIIECIQRLNASARVKPAHMILSSIDAQAKRLIEQGATLALAKPFGKEKLFELTRRAAPSLFAGTEDTADSNGNETGNGRPELEHTGAGLPGTLADAPPDTSGNILLSHSEPGLDQPQQPAPSSASEKLIDDLLAQLNTPGTSEQPADTPRSAEEQTEAAISKILAVEEESVAGSLGGMSANSITSQQTEIQKQQISQSDASVSPQAGTMPPLSAAQDVPTASSQPAVFAQQTTANQNTDESKKYSMSPPKDSLINFIIDESSSPGANSAETESPANAGLPGNGALSGVASAQARDEAKDSPVAAKAEGLSPLPGIADEFIETLMLPLIPGLLYTLKDGIRDAERGAVENNLLAIQDAANSIASKASSFGLVKLEKIAQCVVRATSADDFEAASTLLEDLGAIAKRYIESLEVCYDTYINSSRHSS